MTIDVTKTRIYKRLLPCIRKQDRKFFRESLQAAADEPTANFTGSAKRLIAAFCWALTPQSHAFWSELRKRLIANGHGDVA